jgi:aldose sugar dehydrogenase
MGVGSCGSESKNLPEAKSRQSVGQSGCRLIKNGYGPLGTDRVKLEKVVDGLEVPWGIAFLPSGDWLVTERPGRVRLMRQGVIQRDSVITIQVAEVSEAGLLGIVAHPQFAMNRYFYVYYTFTKPRGNINRVERYQLSEDGTRAQLNKMILDDIPAGVFHDGGRLRFGPDGMLYVGTGDGRVAPSAQNTESLAGKILRITDEGGIPPDNPLPGKAIFLSGIRNTQGFDWKDPKTLFVTDHGPSGDLGRVGHDELTIVTAGANLGWPEVYGCERGTGFSTPSLVWEDAVPPGGAAFYTGNRIPGWKGNFLIGVLGAEHLQRIIPQPDGTLRNEVYFEGTFGRLREVIMSPDGELYVTTSNCDGRGSCGPAKDSILRLTPG